MRYPHEPIAGDLRTQGDGKERGLLKIIAGIAELDFDQIYRRRERAQQQRRLVLGTVAITIMAALGALALVAWLQMKEAEVQRERAEVMLGNVGRSVFLLAEELDRTGSANLPTRAALDQITTDLGHYGGDEPWVEHAKAVAAMAMAEAHLQQGLNYRPEEGVQKMEEALASFEKAQRSAPEDLVLLKALAEACLKLGGLYAHLENANAEAVLKKGLARSLELEQAAPGAMVSGLLVRDAHMNLGRYFYGVGRKEEALVSLESAIQVATPLLDIPLSPQINFSPIDRQRYFQERQALERSIAWLEERAQELRDLEEG